MSIAVENRLILEIADAKRAELNADLVEIAEQTAIQAASRADQADDALEQSASLSYILASQADILHRLMVRQHLIKWVPKLLGGPPVKTQVQHRSPGWWDLATPPLFTISLGECVQGELFEGYEFATIGRCPAANASSRISIRRKIMDRTGPKGSVSKYNIWTHENGGPATVLAPLEPINKSGDLDDERLLLPLGLVCAASKQMTGLYPSVIRALAKGR